MARRRIWAEVAAATAAIAPLQEGLAALNPSWDAIGRVYLSLAETRRDPLRPFALLATYTGRLTAAGKPQHFPLARALKDQASQGQRESLARITHGLSAAARQAPFLRELLDSQRIFQPQALTVAMAYRFLQEVPQLEAAGLVVRVPDWWSSNRPPRPQVDVKIGDDQAKGQGLGSILDFNVQVSLGGQPLTPDEWATLKAAAEGLVFLRGQWVEADPRQLEQVLSVWRHTEALAAREGMTFAQAMRLFVADRPKLPAAGAAESAPAVSAAATRQWSRVSAGRWLTEVLAALRRPDGSAPPPLGPRFLATLRPYQQAGVAWLWRLKTLGLGGCLADDMGLGKTVQILAYLSAIKHEGGGIGPHLIVAPATLVGNWMKEAAKLAPALRLYPAHPSLTPATQLRDGPGDLDAIDVVVTSYGALQRYPWVLATKWHVVVLDEAQAIKNPDTRQTLATKALTSRQRLALTGTPVENRPLDLWSLFDFVNPGLLGSAAEFQSHVRDEADAGRGYARLSRVVKPYILRRLKTDPAVAPDLPGKTEVEVACALTPSQAAVYERIVADLRRDLPAAEGMRRKGLVLTALLKLKQVCGHPSLATGHGDYAPAGSGKLLRALELAGEIADRQEKLLVFTQFREMTQVLDRDLHRLFRRPGCVLHGETPVRERQELVDRFQTGQGPPYFVLSVKAGGTGLTLTAASHVIHFDRWWNPAVEDQATDRAHRIGQRRTVLVHKLTCAGTVEARIAALLTGKRALARDLLDGTGDGLGPLTELTDEELLDLVALDITEATCDA